MRPSVPALAVLLLLGPLAPAAPAGGPAEDGPPVARRAGRIEHGGRWRAWHALLPLNHDPGRPVPLVLALHGGGGSGVGFDAVTHGQFTREVARRGWVVAFPEGVANGWNDGRPLTGRRERARRGVDDVAFLSALIDHLRQTLGVDPERVYATGISNGGFMAIRLALDLSEKVAAVAAVTATLPRALAARVPTQPVGLLLANGTADPLVPYAGGEVRAFGRLRGAVFSTDETIARWRGWVGARQDARQVAIPDRDPHDGTRATLATWEATRGAAVARLRIDGGGHAWPGGRQYLPAARIGPVSRDLDLVPLLFDFFAAHRRAVPPAPAPSPPRPR